MWFWTHLHARHALLVVISARTRTWCDLKATCGIDQTGQWVRSHLEYNNQLALGAPLNVASGDDHSD